MILFIVLILAITSFVILDAQKLLNILQETKRMFKSKKLYGPLIISLFRSF